MTTALARKEKDMRRAHALALAVFGCFSVVLFFPVLLRPAASYIGGESGPAAHDPLAFMWFLTWTPYALAHRLNPFLTNWIFSDSGANLTWNTAVPFIGLVMAPVTVTAGPTVSYNAAVIASLAVSAWTAYYAALRVFKLRFPAALLAGAVYGFSPFETAHAVGHLHMTPAFTPPLLLLVLHEVLVTQRQAPWSNGVNLAALACIQYFISAEILLTECVFASIAVLILALSRRSAVTRGRVVYGLRSLTLAVLIALPVLSYPLYLMFRGPWQPMHPIHGSPDVYAASLLSFVVPTSAQAIFGSTFLQSSLTGGEWNTYLGLPVIALLGFIAWKKRRSGTVQFLFALAITIAVLSLGSCLHFGGIPSCGVPLPWRIFELIPIFRDVETNRFGEYLYLPVGLLIALYVGDTSAPQGRTTLRAAVSLAAAAFLFPRIPLYPAASVGTPAFFRLTGDTHSIGSPALVLPFSSDVAPDRATAMLWQAEAHMAFKMPEGYAFGQGAAPWPAPTSLSRALVEIENSGRVPVMTSAFKADVAAVLREKEIRTVLLGPCAHQREALAFLNEVLGSEPESVDGVFIWRQVGRRQSLNGP
jgi:hypothetical protein